jgi:hypothetical protein
MGRGEEVGLAVGPTSAAPLTEPVVPYNYRFTGSETDQSGQTRMSQIQLRHESTVKNILRSTWFGSVTASSMQPGSADP